MKPESSPSIAIEIASALLVPSAAYGFIRVFDATNAVTPLIGASLLSTAVAVLLRRVRVPLTLATPLSGLFLLALLINRFAPGTATFGLIPTEATRVEFNILIDELVLNFQELKTPVPALDAFVASAMVGAWIMAFLTDWGALRLRLAFEPVLPAGLLFIFSAVLGAGNNRIVATVVFAVAVSFWAVTQRSVNLAESNTWLANDRRRGSLGVAQAAAVLAVIALLVGVITGPRLPGAAAQEMVSFRDTGDPTRVVVSPFVNIEARLVDQTSTQLFTVTSEQPSYWRLAGLDTYEDNIWKVAGSFSPEDGKLPDQDTLGGQRDTILQDYSIDALDTIWLPAAFAPTEIMSATAAVTWNAGSGSLTVANDVASSDGVDYSLESSVPRFTSTELQSAPDTVPVGAIADQYLPLPEIPPIVRTEALRLTADATTSYDKMLALQEHFRGFSYSVNLGPRIGDPVEQFLEERTGFCQQFAGTFTLMARTLQIPARVAIGFTWGDPIGQAEDGRTIYRITGRQTHAWPEVWFEGLGWVAFEPTPGRGAPSAVEYTQVAAAQDSLVQPDNPDGPVTTTTAPQVPAEGVNDGAQIPEMDLAEGSGVSTTPADGGMSMGTVLKILAVLVVAGAYLGGVPGWHWYRRYRRRQKIASTADEVETAWAEVAETLELGFGLNRRPSETRREYARRLAADMRVPRQPMIELAEKATVARYHPGGLGTGDGRQATTLATEIETSVKTRVPVYNRWKRLIDPRRVLKPSARITMTSSLAKLEPSESATSSNGSRPRQLV
ncbi:MAG: transglutaminase domain-containing protein [Actinomycetia bacterium]|nr:transglutaminase domain-containing protein [Actinomycetes bacterium]